MERTPQATNENAPDSSKVSSTPDREDLLLRYLGSLVVVFSGWGSLMRRYPVSNRVNQVQNDDVDCAKPLEREPSPAQSMLF